MKLEIRENSEATKVVMMLLFAVLEVVTKQSELQ